MFAAHSLTILAGMFVLAACPVAFGQATAPSTRPAKVFLLIGQSNMSGRAPLAPGDDQPIPGVLLLNGRGRWEPATNPLNRYSNGPDNKRPQFGPGDSFARAVLKADPQVTIGLIVNARGGSKIEEWARGQHLYEKSMQRLKAVEGLRLTAVLWHPGESNAKDDEYLARLVQLVQDLRQDLRQPDLPFIAGEVGGDLPVNGQIRLLPTKLPGTAVAGAQNPKRFDAFHFDRASQVTLGQRYAEALARVGQRADER